MLVKPGTLSRGTGKVSLSREALAQINEYRSYFETEMSDMDRHLREFKANKEEFYRRWSAYADFNKVQKLFK